MPLSHTIEFIDGVTPCHLSDPMQRWSIPPSHYKIFSSANRIHPDSAKKSQVYPQ